MTRRSRTETLPSHLSNETLTAILHALTLIHDDLNVEYERIEREITLRKNRGTWHPRGGRDDEPCEPTFENRVLIERHENLAPVVRLIGGRRRT
jgi:hypothetical protein